MMMLFDDTINIRKCKLACVGLKLNFVKEAVYRNPAEVIMPAVICHSAASNLHKV